MKITTPDHLPYSLRYIGLVLTVRIRVINGRVVAGRVNARVRVRFQRWVGVGLGLGPPTAVPRHQ